MEYIDVFKLPIYKDSIPSNHIYRIYQIKTNKNGKRYKEYNRNNWI